MSTRTHLNVYNYQMSIRKLMFQINACFYFLVTFPFSLKIKEKSQPMVQWVGGSQFCDGGRGVWGGRWMQEQASVSFCVIRLSFLVREPPHLYIIWKIFLKTVLLLSHNQKCDRVICRDVDESRDCHTE